MKILLTNGESKGFRDEVIKDWEIVDGCAHLNMADGNQFFFPLHNIIEIKIDGPNSEGKGTQGGK